MVRAGVGTGKWGKDVLADLPGTGPDASRSGNHGSDETTGHDVTDCGCGNRTWGKEYPPDRRS